MDLSRDSGVSLWRQIQQTIEGEIASGRFQPGDRLPTEQELSARFGVNRHTVRRALAKLEERGAVRIEQGRGTFVHEAVIDYLVSRHTRFTENLARLNRSVTRPLLGHGEMPADAAIGRALGIRQGVMTIWIETKGEADGRPISVATHYFSKPRFETIVDAYAETHSVTQALKRLGVDDYVRKSTRVSARMPTTEDARRLAQPKTRPVLVAESVNIDRDRRPVEYVVTRFASDWVQIVFEP
jgi:GntR family transcriptional regulator, phosphonate transport system regulatory protein